MPANSTSEILAIVGSSYYYFSFKSCFSFSSVYLRSIHFLSSKVRGQSSLGKIVANTLISSDRGVA